MTLTLDQMEDMATDLEELRGRIGRLEDGVLGDSIAVPNNYFISEGSTKATGESLAEFVDPFTEEEPAMPSWLQANETAGIKPFIGTGAPDWKATPNGLEFIGGAAASSNKVNNALAIPSDYFNVGDVTQPLLSAAIVVLKFKFHAPLPLARETIKPGIRMMDTSNAPEFSEAFPGSPKAGLEVFASFNGNVTKEMVVEWVGYANASVKVKYEVANGTFWLVCILPPELSEGVPAVMVQLWDTPPFNWKTGAATAPLISQRITTGASNFRASPFYHQRVGMMSRPTTKAVSEAEGGTLIESFRVIPLVSLPIPNFTR